MRLNRFYIKTLTILLLVLSATGLCAQHLTINHLHTNIDLIPDSVFTSVKENYRLIHGHLSHGWQIDDGLDSLEVSYPNLYVEIGNYSLPSVTNSLNIIYYYASDEAYWYKGGAERLRGYLDGKPDINVALFSWCRDLDENNAEYVQAYLDTLSMLELEYPEVRFIYATGNAQKSGDIGLLRFNNNNMIRDYCENNGKILYDFADLDCWWFNPATQAWEGSFYTINTTDVPVEHTQFHQELWHHTTVESGIQKAKALWWLLARLSGWPGSTPGTPPVAVNDTVATLEDIEVTINVLANDYAPTGSINPSTVTVTESPANGAIIEINTGTGSITYKPDLNYNGSDVFKYVVKNDNNDISNAALVRINIAPVNDPPQKFNLINPAQNDTIDLNDDTVVFFWSASKDVDDDILHYELSIYGTAGDTLIADIADTSFSFAGRAFWQDGNLYNWSINVTDGEFSVSSADTFSLYIPFIDLIENRIIDIPQNYNLFQNYPNPFNPLTSIQFAMPVAGRVVINILDVTGRLVEKIMDENKPAGYHRIEYNAGNLASGVYLYQIRIRGSFTQEKKMMVIK